MGHPLLPNGVSCKGRDFDLTSGIDPAGRSKNRTLANSARMRHPISNHLRFSFADPRNLFALQSVAHFAHLVQIGLVLDSDEEIRAKALPSVATVVSSHLRTLTRGQNQSKLGSSTATLGSAGAAHFMKDCTGKSACATTTDCVPLGLGPAFTVGRI
jgi:hypothetical protein